MYAASAGPLAGSRSRSAETTAAGTQPPETSPDAQCGS